MRELQSDPLINPLLKLDWESGWAGGRALIPKPSSQFGGVNKRKPLGSGNRGLEVTLCALTSEEQGVEEGTDRAARQYKGCDLADQSGLEISNTKARKMARTRLCFRCTNSCGAKVLGVTVIEKNEVS